MKPTALHILNTLMDGAEHSALEWKRGQHGMFIDTVSQRISELRALGYPIESTGRGGHATATYRLAARFDGDQAVMVL